MKNLYLHLDPFLTADDAEAMFSIAKSLGSFGTYADEGSSDSLGEELPQRFDVGVNYFERGLDGKGNADTEQDAASRTNYFRETYVYGNELKVSGIEPFLAHPALSESAREISACANVVPAIVYANILLPGQELAIHTDVPEFRGVNRKSVPQWLLVVMLHSGLFERWRIPILTCVSWFGSARGGAFTFYPDGANGERASFQVHHNTAILLDTDKVFHGVERVAQVLPKLPPIGRHTRLHYCGGEDWELREMDEPLAEFKTSQLRYSISWKAYCFENDDAEALWRSGEDDIEVTQILETLEASLREKNLLVGERPEPTDFALLLVNSFVRFPGQARQRPD